MRFTRRIPAGPEELRAEVLADPESLAPGLRVVATSLPLGDRGILEALAADGRGRLALLAFSLDAGQETVARAIDQWDWVITHLPALRAFSPPPGVDLASEPRLLLVAHRVGAAARRLAFTIRRPEIEMFEASLIGAGDQRGILVERAGADRPAGTAAPSGIDPVLADVPSGASRSIIRRILEELRDHRAGGERFQPVGVDSDIDLLVGGRVVASLLATPTGVEVRRFENAETRRVDTDDACREAVAFIIEASRRPAPGEATVPRAARPAPAAPQGAAAGALTPEEIAEFEKITATVESQPETRPAPAVRIARTGFVEN